MYAVPIMFETDADAVLITNSPSNFRFLRDDDNSAGRCTDATMNFTLDFPKIIHFATGLPIPLGRAAIRAKTHGYPLGLWDQATSNAKPIRVRK
jgi:hypothetical protein